jgi:hypothetical protein
MAAWPLTIYKDKSYGGVFANLTYGNYGDLGTSTGVPRNSISSLRIQPFVKVTLYTETYFTGKMFVIIGPSDMPDLSLFYGNINDTIASIKVEAITPSLITQVNCCRGQTPSYQCGPYMPSSQTCTESLREYSTQNLHLNESKEWCKSHPELCDTAVIGYCQRYPDDPYCSCINSPANVKGVVNPKCVDRKCITSGYLTSSMLATPCPTVINCDIQTQLYNSGVVLSNQIPIQQNCGTTGTMTSSVTTIPTSSTSTNNVKYIIVFLLIIFVIVMAIVFAALAISWGDTSASASS